MGWGELNVDYFDLSQGQTKRQTLYWGDFGLTSGPRKAIHLPILEPSVFIAVHQDHELNRMAPLGPASQLCCRTWGLSTTVGSGNRNRHQVELVCIGSRARFEVRCCYPIHSIPYLHFLPCHVSDLHIVVQLFSFLFDGRKSRSLSQWQEPWVWWCRRWRYQNHRHMHKRPSSARWFGNPIHQE